MKNMRVIAVGASCLMAVHIAGGIDYKKNVIVARGITNTFTFSSSGTVTPSNVSTVTSREPVSSSDVSDFDWGDRAWGHKTLDRRIRDAEQRLSKLYFIRDVCRTLDDEIRISFDKKDIREVVNQVFEIIGTDLPYEVPQGTHLVEKSDVSGMPAHEFLDRIAQVCGLTLKYEQNRLVFEHLEKRAPSK